MNQVRPRLAVKQARPGTLPGLSSLLVQGGEL
jgi:hypothetical protein